jgi:hypothetical protein
MAKSNYKFFNGYRFFTFFFDKWNQEALMLQKYLPSKRR